MPPTYHQNKINLKQIQESATAGYIIKYVAGSTNALTWGFATATELNITSLPSSGSVKYITVNSSGEFGSSDIVTTGLVWGGALPTTTTGPLANATMYSVITAGTVIDSNLESYQIENGDSVIVAFGKTLTYAATPSWTINGLYGTDFVIQEKNLDGVLTATGTQSWSLNKLIVATGTTIGAVAAKTLGINTTVTLGSTNDTFLKSISAALSNGSVSLSGSISTSVSHTITKKDYGNTSLSGIGYSQPTPGTPTFITDEDAFWDTFTTGGSIGESLVMWVAVNGVIDLQASGKITVIAGTTHKKLQFEFSSGYPDLDTATDTIAIGVLQTSASSTHSLSGSVGTEVSITPSTASALVSVSVQSASSTPSLT